MAVKTVVGMAEMSVSGMVDNLVGQLVDYWVVWSVGKSDNELAD